MELRYSLYFMLIGSFIIQYIVMSLIMTNTYHNITFSVGKFYISIIMSLLMGLLEIIMYDTHMHTFSSIYYAIFSFLLVVFSSLKFESLMILI